VYLQVKLCDPHLSTFEMKFSRRGAIQIYVYVYLYLYGAFRAENHAFNSRSDYRTGHDDSTINRVPP